MKELGLLSVYGILSSTWTLLISPVLSNALIRHSDTKFVTTAATSPELNESVVTPTNFKGAELKQAVNGTRINSKSFQFDKISNRNSNKNENLTAGIVSTDPLLAQNTGVLQHKEDNITKRFIFPWFVVTHTK